MIPDITRYIIDIYCNDFKPFLVRFKSSPPLARKSWMRVSDSWQSGASSPLKEAVWLPPFSYGITDALFRTSFRVLVLRIAAPRKAVGKRDLLCECSATWKHPISYKNYSISSSLYQDGKFFCDSKRLTSNRIQKMLIYLNASAGKETLSAGYHYNTLFL